ncbi:MAG: hypothetical protein JWQ50_1558 [Caballeronia mineralivorans]|nr:hypothetical protein [Caballeronia mineralivorans]
MAFELRLSLFEECLHRLFRVVSSSDRSGHVLFVPVSVAQTHVLDHVERVFAHSFYCCLEHELTVPQKFNWLIRFLRDAEAL